MLYVLTTEGEVLRSFELGTADYIFEAQLDFGPDGNLYMMQIDDNTGITVYDTEGRLLRENVGQQALRDAFRVRGFAVGADGTLYVAGVEGPLYHLANDGTLLGAFGGSYRDAVKNTGTEETPPPPGTFANIGAIGVLSDGDVIVGDASRTWWQLVRVHFER